MKCFQMYCMLYLGIVWMCRWKIVLMCHLDFMQQWSSVFCIWVPCSLHTESDLFQYMCNFQIMKPFSYFGLFSRWHNSCFFHGTYHGTWSFVTFFHSQANYFIPLQLLKLNWMESPTKYIPCCSQLIFLQIDTFTYWCQSFN